MDNNVANLVYLVESGLNNVALLQKELENEGLSEARHKSALSNLGREAELLSSSLTKLHSAYEALPEPPQTAQNALERVQKHDWLGLGLMFLDGVTHGLCDRCGGVLDAANSPDAQSRPDTA